MAVLLVGRSVGLGAALAAASGAVQDYFCAAVQRSMCTAAVVYVHLTSSSCRCASVRPSHVNEVYHVCSHRVASLTIPDTLGT